MVYYNATVWFIVLMCLFKISLMRSGIYGE